MDELIVYLRALVYLQAAQLTGEAEGLKVEVLLARAGLPYKEIALLVGKKESAVAKVVSRARIAMKGAEE